MADFIEQRDWQLDLNSGAVAFGGDLRYRIQLLGTESHRDGTWLWAWANQASNLPPGLLHLCTWLQDYGRREGVAELTTPSFPLERADGHRLALLASGLTGRPYYRGPYDGGAVFFHLEGIPAQVTAPVRPERALTVLNQVIMGFEVDHRTAAAAFLQQQGWRVEPAGAALTGTHPAGSSIRIEFDHLGRLSDMSATLAAER
ncbi:hypothetical protein KZZ52_24530 [Dactylosporangium sp. AC04546]|uniref:DUF6882 domain-containing protein n=1 Tax=Dactylosporangium sp. AC04546 TaxID=2862460 RepID=UPI002E7BAED8|nr:DUF6882 domain-containing protein [Dactylosporangium sp. AC04546]WVK88442.1 hypothetical protein KZZ52_24530 [Dactylosporangium sp. AC04546]